MRAVIAGSFDPFTVGHLELVVAALKAFPEAKILVNNSGTEKHYMFSLEDRIKMVELSCQGLPVKIEVLETVLPNHLTKDDVVIRGIRNSEDLNYEQSLRYGYDSIAGESINIMYVIPREHTFVSSSLVRQMISLGASSFKMNVVPAVAAYIEKIKKAE